MMKALLQASDKPVTRQSSKCTVLLKPNRNIVCVVWNCLTFSAGFNGQMIMIRGNELAANWPINKCDNLTQTNRISYISFVSLLNVLNQTRTELFQCRLYCSGSTCFYCQYILRRLVMIMTLLALAC